MWRHEGGIENLGQKSLRTLYAEFNGLLWCEFGRPYFIEKCGYQRANEVSERSKGPKFIGGI